MNLASPVLLPEPTPRYAPAPGANHPARRVAVVGAGPWGVYATERLADRAFRDGIPLELWVVDPAPRGHGPNFAPHLPEYELLNYPMADVAPWEGDGSRILPPGLHTLRAWMERSRPGRVPPGDQPVPRREVGAYFTAVLDHLSHMRSGAFRVHRLAEDVSGVQSVPIGWRLRGAGGPLLDASHVLLATGLPYGRPPDDLAASLADSAQRHRLVHAARWRPGDEICALPAGQPALVLGLGISAIDVFLSLTEGRGGRFEARGDGRLRYVPSGREPRPIIAFSRSGRLPAPKTLGAWPHEASRPLRVLDAEAIRRLRGRSGSLDFERDVWPLVREEMALELDRLRAAPLPRGIGSLELAGALATLPVAGRDRHDVLIARLREDLRLARYGVDGSWEQALKEVWARAFGALVGVLSCGGLTAVSQRRFSREIRPAWGRLAFGPPLANALKLEALLADRFVDLSHADATVEVRGGSYRLGDGVEARALVDARTPVFDLRRDTPAPYRNLHVRGFIRPFTNGNGPDALATGAVDVDQEGFAYREPGVRSLGVVGAATEGCILGTDALPSRRVAWPARWADAVVAEVARSADRAAGRAG